MYIFLNTNVGQCIFLNTNTGQCIFSLIFFIINPVLVLKKYTLTYINNKKNQ